MSGGTHVLNGDAALLSSVSIPSAVYAFSYRLLRLRFE
jgi:hypothetical protein